MKGLPDRLSLGTLARMIRGGEEEEKRRRDGGEKRKPDRPRRGMQ
jgi:hypothetical protein